MASFGEEGFTDLNFVDDAVIFADIMEGLIQFLEALNEESGHLRLRINWMNPKIQHFIQTVDQACDRVICCGNNVDVVEVFPYLCSQITSDGSVLKEIDRRLGVAGRVMALLKQV